MPEIVRPHTLIDVRKRMGAGLIYRPDAYTADRDGADMYGKVVVYIVLYTHCAGVVNQGCVIVRSVNAMRTI